MATQIKLEIEGLKELKSNLDNYPAISAPIIQQAILKGTQLVEEGAKREAPVDTGRLRSTIRGRLTGPLTGMVEVTAKYAAWVHGGTKAHIIKPKNKKALAIGPGIFRKSAKHPGTQANPFLERGAETKNSDIIQVFQNALEAISERLIK